MDLFVKFYVTPVKQGLLRQLKPELFAVLATLSVFMDRNGTCYPSQTQLAYLTGTSRQTINKRIKHLSEITWKGEHLITITKERKNGKYDSNVYQLNTALFKIFEVKRELKLVK